MNRIKYTVEVFPEADNYYEILFRVSGLGNGKLDKLMTFLNHLEILLRRSEAYYNPTQAYGYILLRGGPEEAEVVKQALKGFLLRIGNGVSRRPRDLSRSIGSAGARGVLKNMEVKNCEYG